MKITLNQVSNPGISFTSDINEKLISLYELIQKNNNYQSSYQDFQEKLINNELFSGSYIRSFIPFLYNCGIINDYTNIIDFKKFFTTNGKLYIETIINIFKLDSNDKEKKYLNNIKADLLCLSLDYMINNNYKFYNKYIDILVFIKKYKTINREEFYILEYCKQNNIDVDELITSYRNDPKSISIFVYDRNGEELSYRSNNAFNYFVSFLSEDQCNYICKLNQSDYQINEDRGYLIDSLMEQYCTKGGKYE